MDMRMTLHRTALLLVTLAFLLLAANFTAAQGDTTKRLRSPATARGFVGGESHDGYVIHARKGQLMTVRIGWLREDDNRAEFSVSDSPDFGGQVEFGRVSDKGRRWSGRIPATGDYYIYVVAHPTAQYKLKVRVK